MGPDPVRPGRATGDARAERGLSRYFPVALDLHGRRCLVVGGGTVATRKVRALLDAGAHVVVVAPEISMHLEALLPAESADRSPPTLELRRRPFGPGDIDDVFLVCVATDDHELNDAVADAARARRVLVNAADDPANCDFILPAVVQRGDVQIAITTGGQSPALARHLRERLDRDVPREYGPLAEALAVVRDELRTAGRRASADAWQDAISDAALQALAAGDVDGAIDEIRSHLLLNEDGNRGDRPDELAPSAGSSSTGADLRPSSAPVETQAARSRPSSASGRIVLVGAGPGDPGLLTVGGQQAIAQADVVVYDRLVNPALLAHARSDARIVYAGKHRGGGPMSQEAINQLICDEAQAGRTVVRLKGGDPFVFGRGGEEALAAARVGIPVTVIPGITAAVAAPAYAGIPVTHRGVSSSFTVLTGHEDPTKAASAVEWQTLARFGGTLILLMGVDTLPAICARLLEAGLPATTPAAVIQDATLPTQRSIVGTVEDIAPKARAAGIKAPATTVIGKVVDLASSLRWWQAACEP